MTDYMKRKLAHALLRIRNNNHPHEYYDAYDAADPEVQQEHDRILARDRRRRMAYYPNPGNSEVIMRNRVRRAKSFGLERDNQFNSPVNRGTR